MPSDVIGARSSVILIREWENQMSSSGCYDRLERNSLLSHRGERCFPERRATMEAMGPLYRDLRARYSDAVDIHVVDPRNLVTMFALLLRDTRAHGLPVLDAIRTLFRLSVTSVVVNGQILTRGRWPAPAEVDAVLGYPPAQRASVGVA